MRLRQLLLSEQPATRLFALWGAGLALCMLAWIIGYRLLPEAFLRDVFPAPGLVPDDGTLAATAWRILGYNVLIAGGVILAANLFRVGWFPLGYLPPLAHWSIFGLLLGSNSFDVSRERVAPSFVHLAGTIGFIEISAYTFIASATIGLFMYRQQSWLNQRTTKVRSSREIRLSWCEAVTVGISVALILMGAYRESLSLLLARI